MMMTMMMGRSLAHDIAFLDDHPFCGANATKWCARGPRAGQRHRASCEAVFTLGATTGMIPSVLGV